MAPRRPEAGIGIRRGCGNGARPRCREGARTGRFGITRREWLDALVGMALGIVGFLLFCLSIVLGGWVGFWLAGSPGGG